MPRKFAIKDGKGNVLGRFTAPDGATKEEIEKHYARFRQELLAKQAAREVARTEPVAGSVICQLCRKPKPADQIGNHVRREAKELGIDID